MSQSPSPDPIRSLTIEKEATLLQALQRMDERGTKLLLVNDGGRFHSLVSIGDIQRAIIRNQPLDTPVATVLRPDVRVAYERESFEVIRQRMIEHRTECMPVLNERNELVRVYFWDDIFAPHKRSGLGGLNVPVVIMAGGKGERLRPLTHVIPKPLIPVGDKPIIDEILGRFHACGADEFHISLNYKAEMIQRYLEESPRPYRLHYFQEEKPLGTAGSLHLLRGSIRSTFFVSNCDILVDQDFREVLRHHQEHRHEITAVAALRLYPVPYGILTCDESGLLKEVREKPSISFLVNVGLYVLEPHLLSEIPPDRVFHLTDLMKHVRQRGGRVGVFPVREGDWLDIGEWKDYFSTTARFARQRPGSAIFPPVASGDAPVEAAGWQNQSLNDVH